MKIQEIYKKYKIMPNLQDHQMRVASVARLIIENLREPVETDAVIKACLFHDMGNILKFDLNYFPEFLKPEGLEYWQTVKNEYFNKYGSDEHVATEKICSELGFTESDFKYLKSIGFTQAKKVLESNSLGQMICCYADQRVGPNGVVSLTDRFADGAKRYADRPDRGDKYKEREDFASALRKMEEMIFSKCELRPEEIDDNLIRGYYLTFSK